MPPDFFLYLGATLAMSSLTAIIVLIAGRCGFFYLPPCHAPVSYQIAPYLYLTTLATFAFFLILESTIVPYFIYLTLCGETLSCHLSYVEKGWGSIINVLVGFLAVLTFTLTRQYHLREAIWGSFSWRHFAIGTVSWLISYPTMLTVGMLTATLVTLFTPQHPSEQLVVQELRHLQEHPLLQMVIALTIVTLVPITEESLFRGLLQNSLQCLLPRSLSIALTACIFSLFHLSSEQGIANYQLFTSLFTLACFLGFIYERQQSLWAPIALHAIFNAISMVRIFS